MSLSHRRMSSWWKPSSQANLAVADTIRSSADPYTHTQNTTHTTHTTHTHTQFSSRTAHTHKINTQHTHTGTYTHTHTHTHIHTTHKHTHTQQNTRTKHTHTHFGRCVDRNWERVFAARRHRRRQGKPTHSAAPPSTFSRRFNRDGEGISAKCRCRRCVGKANPRGKNGLDGTAVKSEALKDRSSWSWFRGAAGSTECLSPAGTQSQVYTGSYKNNYHRLVFFEFEFRVAFHRPRR